MFISTVQHCAILWISCNCRCTPLSLQWLVHCWLCLQS